VTQTQKHTNTPTEPSDDIDTIVAALKLLGLDPRVQVYGADGESTEVRVAAAHPDSDYMADSHREGGLLFRFKHGRLVELRARCLPDYDKGWDVSAQPTFEQRCAQAVEWNKPITNAYRM
jgi:hypothetical protein